MTIFVSILSFIQIGIGYAFDIKFISNSPVLVIFMLFLSFGLSMQAIGFMISTACENVKTGYAVAYAFILLAIVMQLFFSGGYIIYYLYSDEVELWEKIVRFILE